MRFLPRYFVFLILCCSRKGFSQLTAPPKNSCYRKTVTTVSTNFLTLTTNPFTIDGTAPPETAPPTTIKTLTTDPSQ